jgi:hypothetical protein
MPGTTACASSIGACTLTSNMIRWRLYGYSLGAHIDRGCRIVDQDVDATSEDLERTRHDAGAAGGVSQDPRQRPRPSPVTATTLERLAQAAGQVVVLIDRAGDDDDVGAFGSQPLGQRGTDTATRTGHNGVLAREAIHEVSLPSR